ncbi:MAG: hypothetical protein P0120_02915 [Nitrospira sp.]|nr:hypothetical protein [Nitrospira sp.]
MLAYFDNSTEQGVNSGLKGNSVACAKTPGDRRWELDQGATLYDVTHLACHSARYTPATGGNSCSPANAKQTAFPVAPGGTMPPVKGCTKQDYAVLIVIGVGVED